MLESVIPGDNEKKFKGEGREGVVLSINETRVFSRKENSRGLLLCNNNNNNNVVF